MIEGGWEGNRGSEREREIKREGERGKESEGRKKRGRR